MVAGRARPPCDDPRTRPGRETGQPTVWLRDAQGGVAAITLSWLRLRDLAGSVPWRRWRSRRGQAHLSGSYWAATTGGHVVHESRLELARLLLADFDATVVAIWAQPFRLVATVGGSQRQHVPDFLLGSTGGEVSVVNVKPAARLEDPKIAEALMWPGELITAHGWRYEVWSGCDAVLLDNVRFLAGYRRPGVVDAALMARAWRQARDGDTVAELERRLAGDSPAWTVRPAVLALLWRQRLTTDLSRPLSGDAVLRRCP